MEEATEKPVTHIAVPIALMQAVSGLIAEQISWGLADPVMSALKTQTLPIRMEGNQVSPPTEAALFSPKLVGDE